MHITNRSYFLLGVLALVAASTLALTGAFAGEAAPPTAKAPAAAGAPAAKLEAPATKTPSPMHTMMGWFAHQVVGDLESPCPSCPKAEAAWRAWFEGGKDVPLVGLRDRLVADGWTADRYIDYFRTMAAAHAKTSGEGCGSGTGDCGDCPSKGGCKDCPSKADKPGCGSCPGNCPGDKPVEPEPESTAAR